MKKKKTNILLIVFLALVWGGVIYRMVTYKRDHSYAPTNIVAENSSLKTDTFVDTFDLKLNYRDPFLDAPMIVAKPNRPIKTTKHSKQTGEDGISKIKNQNTNNSDQCPEIVYSSYVEKNGKLTAIVKINSAKYLVNKADDVNGVRIINISKESIHIKWNNQTKIIYRQ